MGQDEMDLARHLLPSLPEVSGPITDPNVRELVAAARADAIVVVNGRDCVAIIRKVSKAGLDPNEPVHYTIGFRDASMFDFFKD